VGLGGTTDTPYGLSISVDGSTDPEGAGVRIRIVVASLAIVAAALAIPSAIDGYAWRGDSGGPQVYRGAQMGVASTADDQSRQYYASVADNRSWITSVAGV
jgi:hypothetical protein